MSKSKTKFKTLGTTLTIEEYEQLAKWCKKNGYTPGGLLHDIVLSVIHRKPDMIKLEAKVNRMLDVLDKIAERVDWLSFVSASLQEQQVRHVLELHGDSLTDRDRARWEALLKDAMKATDAARKAWLKSRSMEAEKGG